ITCIDADPNRTLSQVLGLTKDPRIDCLESDSEQLLAHLRGAQVRSDLVLIDLEGTPTRPCFMRLANPTSCWCRHNRAASMWWKPSRQSASYGRRRILWSERSRIAWYCLDRPGCASAAAT